IPLNGDQNVLKRGDNKEDPEQCAMIAEARRSQSDKLPQGEEGSEAEQNDRTDAAGEHGEAEYEDHDPPGLDAGVQVVDGDFCGFTAGTRAQYLSDDRGEEQEGQNAAHEPEGLVVQFEF